MVSNRLAFVALALACIGAAAGGGYLATPQNTIPTPAAAQGQPVTTTAAPGAPAAQPARAVETAKAVQETETVISGASPRTATPASKPGAVRKPEAGPRNATREHATRPHEQP